MSEHKTTVSATATEAFNRFWDNWSKATSFELPEDSLTELKTEMLKAFATTFPQGPVTARPAPAPVPAPVGARRVTGYNLFMRATMATLKEEGVASGERLKEVGARWKLLDEAGKAEWNAQAKADAPVAMAGAPVPASRAPAGARRPTGYNLFMKATMATLKEEGMAAGERLKEVGARWKALDEAGKAEWNALAKA